MSKIKKLNGDDYPAAAEKHLHDSQILIGAQRADGAAYLSGYVVECSLKAIGELERQSSPVTAVPEWKGSNGHRLSQIESDLANLATVAGSKTARYFGPVCASLSGSAIMGWKPEQRYLQPSIALSDAQAFVQVAENLFYEVVGQMVLDGVI